MKKILSIILSSTVLFMVGCGKSDSPKIEGLIVPGCLDLANDLKKNNPDAGNDEIYQGASDILFSDGRLDEAVLCCDNIVDENAKTNCKSTNVK